MKLKKDPRDVVYNFDGVNYVGSYDSNGDYHPPCQPPKSGRSCGAISYNISSETKEAISLSKTENDYLKSEIAFLTGKIEAYEKFLKDRGYIKEEE